MSALVLTKPHVKSQALSFATILVGVYYWLFMTHDVEWGLSIGIFILLLGSSCCMLNMQEARSKFQFVGVLAYFSAALILFEEVSGLSLSLALVLAISGTMLMNNQIMGNVTNFIFRCLKFPFLALLFSISDLKNPPKILSKKSTKQSLILLITQWLMPIIIGIAFIALFAKANPIIENWLNKIDLWYILSFLDPSILIELSIVFLTVWAFLRWHGYNLLEKFGFKKSTKAPEEKTKEKTEQQNQIQVFYGIFSHGAILRSLIVFNVIFVVQIVMDGLYLWGGLELPKGMTYASYAHRGAYPLIVTALLAALFVLIALRPGSKSEGDKLLRALVYLWVGQNIVLVLASIFRLDLYISVYQLTFLRVAAMIWMGLVASGLLLIVLRIVLKKTGQWLIASNFAMLGFVLISCCFVDFSGFIANYNVDKAIENNRELDIYYLKSAGIDTVPALYHYMNSDKISYNEKSNTRAVIQNIIHGYVPCYKEWRSCTFSRWRKEQEIKAKLGIDMAALKEWYLPEIPLPLKK